MPTLSIVTGVILLLLGVGGYVLTGMESWTALIPAFLGLPLALLGGLALKPALRKHAMHAAAGLALLGLLGSMRGVPNAITLMRGEEVARPAAAVAQAIMALICLIFLVMAIKSFVDARRTRNQTAQPSI